MAFLKGNAIKLNSIILKNEIEDTSFRKPEDFSKFKFHRFQPQIRF